MKRLLAALILCGLAASAWAADTPISNLPSGGPEQPGDLFPATRQGVTYGVTVITPPLGSTSTPGVVACGSGTTCSEGVLSITNTAGTQPASPMGAIQYNADGVHFGALSITGTGQVLVGTNGSGAMAPVTLVPGNNGNLLYNNNGVPGPYAIGSGLVVTTTGGESFLNSTSTGGVAPSGTVGAIQFNANGSFGGVNVPSNSLIGGYTAGMPISIVVGTGLSLTTSGGITSIIATGSGGTCPSNGIAEENGPCIIEENGPYIIEE